MRHTEIPIKVNAWVDQGIAPLVNALNLSDEIITLDSCEGADNTRAHVYFSCYRGADALLDVVRELAKGLSDRLDGDDGYCFRIEWAAGSREPIAALLVSRNHITTVAQAVEAALPSVAPKMASSCGTKYKAPHNSTTHRSHQRSRRVCDGNAPRGA